MVSTNNTLPGTLIQGRRMVERLKFNEDAHVPQRCYFETSLGEERAHLITMPILNATDPPAPSYPLFLPIARLGSPPAPGLVTSGSPLTVARTR